MRGVSATLLIVTGFPAGLVRATLETPISNVADLGTIVNIVNTLTLSGGGADSNVNAELLRVKMQPALLQKSGELIRFVEVCFQPGIAL